MEARIIRFSFRERVIHWLAALTFLFAALSGLALWTPALYWLSALFGGGQSTRAVHPWGGIAFTIMLALMFAGWARYMKISRDDRRWLRDSHLYAMHKESGLPTAGRYNAGQKMLFWLQVIVTVGLLATGLLIWFPEAVAREILAFAVLLHAIAAVAAIGSIILHIYMGVFVVPGSMTAMTRGTVTSEWVDAHHSGWTDPVRMPSRK